jgi:hypothetical protein
MVHTKNERAHHRCFPAAGHRAHAWRVVLDQGRKCAQLRRVSERICATLQPRDSLEEIWIRDIVDLVWETFRLRRAKANLMTDAARDQVASKLDGSHPRALQIACDWAAGDEDAASHVERTLASAGLSMDRLVARAMSYMFKDMERLDRMLVSVENRRSAALRELANYRAPLAQKLRRAIAQAEEAELVPDAPRLAPPQPA